MIPVLEDIIRGLLDGTMTPEQARAWLEQHEQLARERESQVEDDFDEEQARMDIAAALGSGFNPELFDMHRQDDSAGVAIYVIRKLIEAGFA